MTLSTHTLTKIFFYFILKYNFNIFIKDTAEYNEFIVYNDIGIMSGRAGIKTPDNKFNITIIRS